MSNMTNREKCLKTLRDSFTFQMSLGSKELFHTNFLQWLSFIDWDKFLEVLHVLSGINEFWWEKQNCSIETVAGASPMKFCPKNENIEVRREYHNYDLSIYILVGFSNPRKKKNVPQKKWRPVLILENKVKSMPYQEQLDGYARKIYNEWESSFPARDRTLHDWNSHGVTALLLTLFDGICINSSDIGDSSSLKWEVKNYGDLSKIVGEKFQQINGKEKEVIDDYRSFIENLHCLSQTAEWMINESDIYYDIIKNCSNEEVKLRIADLREKVLYERMLNILVCKFQKSSVLNNNNEHWSKDNEYTDDKNKRFKTGIVFYETAFSHGTGAIQAQIIINNTYRLMIQLQGAQYRKCVILHKRDKAKMDSICKQLSLSIWKDYKTTNSFGDSHVYNHFDFKNKETVGDVLNKFIIDLETIINNKDKLVKLT